MNEADLRTKIATALAAFPSRPLPVAATDFFATLGYSSDRTIPVGSVEAFCRQFDPQDLLAHPAAMKDQWKFIHLLFQLTDEELSRHTSLFKETAIAPGLLSSYLFFAVELAGGDYARGRLTGIARQLNRIFPMPVMVLIKHLTDSPRHIVAHALLLASLVPVCLAVVNARPPPTMPIPMAVTIVVLLVVWLFRVNPEWVRLTSEAYTLRLLASCDQLSAGSQASKPPSRIIT